MHGHEKRIVKEVLSSERSIHMVYKGARIGVILKEIIRTIKEPLVIIGSNPLYMDIVKKLPKNKSDKNSSCIKATKIEIKTSNASRRRIYSEEGSIFVSEQIFLSDILKDSIPQGKGKVVYLVGNEFVHRSKPVMDFIMFAVRMPISIIFTCNTLWSFSDLVDSGYFSSSQIFLYPSFRKSVERSLGDFDITEITILGGKERELIQNEILELIKKIESNPEKGVFECYIESARNILRACLVLLYNASISAFIKGFNEATDIDNNMCVLVGQYGVPDSMHARNTVYRNALGWIVGPQIEEIKEVAKSILRKEKEAPKEAVILDLLKKEKYKNTCILSHKLPINIFNSPNLEIKSSKFFSSLIRKIVERPSPQVILVNYSIDFLRRFKMARERWRKRGVEIGLTVIRVKNSIEEIDLLEAITKEKDHFISAIGIKQNRPKTIERKFFKKVPDDPKAPLLEIDMRELRSKLPLHLAQHFSNTFKFEFKNLSAGDYALNNTYFIERKRIDDFVGSLSSGRLFKQMQALDLFERTPYLLIEFPESARISFISYMARTAEIDLIPKIVNLLLSLKNIHIFYSSNERHSSALVNFLGRKAPEKTSNRKEKACMPRVVEALLAIPGIDYQNVQVILNNFASLYDLITSEKHRITNTLGSELGEKVYSFFNDR